MTDPVSAHTPPDACPKPTKPPPEPSDAAQSVTPPQEGAERALTRAWHRVYFGAAKIGGGQSAECRPGSPEVHALAHDVLTLVEENERLRETLREIAECPIGPGWTSASAQRRLVGKASQALVAEGDK